MSLLLGHPHAEAWLLLAIAVSSIVVAVCAVLGVTTLRLVNNQLGEKASFSDHAQSLLDRGELTALVELAAERLLTFNDDASAHYFLGLALFRQGELRKSLSHLKRVPELQAGWNIQPMIAAIELQLANLNDKPELTVVPSSPSSERP